MEWPFSAQGVEVHGLGGAWVVHGWLSRGMGMGGCLGSVLQVFRSEYGAEVVRRVPEEVL